jgi:telomere length regulation protein
VKLLLDELIVQEKIEAHQFNTLIKLLTTYEQRQFLLSTLRVMSSKYLMTVSEAAESNSISACSTLLRCLLDENTTIADDLCDYLYTTPCSMALARVAISALDIQHVEKLLHRVWESFGDKLHIRHDSILQQESTARLLLLCAAYVHRAQPMDLFMHARSSIHSNAMSNRLASSSPRLRLLAMFVGEAISQLVDKDKKTKMIFKLDGADGQEGELWRELVFIVDKPKTVSLLRATSRSEARPVGTAKLPKAIPTRKAKEAKPIKSKIVEVTSEPDEDDDLVPFAKPDSDPEDSDEDATLVQRNKPKAPVLVHFRAA